VAFLFALREVSLEGVFAYNLHHGPSVNRETIIKWVGLERINVCFFFESKMCFVKIAHIKSIFMNNMY
jgi:hypothetical protein